MASIRPATEEDIPGILDLYGELAIRREAVRPSLEEARRVFAEIAAGPGHDIFVAEEGGQITGSIVLLTVPNLSHGARPWAIAENVIVSEKQRRRGTGRMLLEHAIARARDRGCYKIQLTSDERRREAHEFYDSLGFKASAYGFRLYFDKNEGL